MWAIKTVKLPLPKDEIEAKGYIVTRPTRPGTFYILVGPGGVGKNALMNAVLDRLDNLRQLPTATTRAPRAGEQQGIHHIFVDVEEFQRMIRDGEFLEHQEVHPGKFYGVPRSKIAEAVDAGEDLIADIEFKGATIIRESYPEDTVAIFVSPPSIASLIQRMTDRQDNQTDINNRLNRMSSEMIYAPLCDYVLVNDDFDKAIDELEALIDARRHGTQIAQPAYNARFFARINIRWQDEHLLDRDLNDIVIEIDSGQIILETIAKQLSQRLQLNVDPQDMQLSQPDQAIAVDLSLEPQTQTYTVTYNFLLNLAEKVDAPFGYQWMHIEPQADEVR